MHTCRTSAGSPPWAWRSGGEIQHRLVVSALGGEQQPLGVQIVHDGDVVLASAQAGLVDTDNLHAFALQFARLIDVVLDAPPQPVESEMPQFQAAVSGAVS